MAINDAGLVEIVGGHLHIHLIANGNTDEIFPHFAGDMGEDFVSVGEGDAKHGARQHLRHVSRQFDWLFFRHKTIEPSNVAAGGGKINYFQPKKQVDKGCFYAKFPPTMKSETLNGVLTFVLGVLVVLGVIFTLRVVIISRELRSMQTVEAIDRNVMLRTQAIYTDASAYNKQYRDAELTRILQSITAKPAPASH